MCITHSIDDSEVDHVTVSQCLIDAQYQCLPSVPPPLPLLSAVSTQQSQGEILPIRPFPMQEFLDSHELSVLLSILDPSNDGTFFLDPIILHPLKFLRFCVSSQSPNRIRSTNLLHLISKVVASYTIDALFNLTLA